MSIDVMSAVWQLDLPQAQKLVLLAIADHANDEGFAFPSMSRIAWKCGYEQKRTVSDIIKKLLESHVLAVVQNPAGRSATCYQVRPHLGQRLPEFEAKAFKSRASGAENAPHDETASPKSLNPEGIDGAENARGAENAPQTLQPVDNPSVGVRSAHVEVRSDARRGAVATAPESYNHHLNQDARARASPASSPARAGPPQVGGEEFLLDNQARQLQISKRQHSETITDYRRRIAAAHDRELHAKAAARAASRRAESETTLEPADTEEPVT